MLKRLALLCAAVCLAATVKAQTTITGTFLTPSGQTPTAAGLKTLQTVAGTAVCGELSFVPYNASTGHVASILWNGKTYPPQVTLGYIRCSDGALLSAAGGVGISIVPNVDAQPTGTLTWVSGGLTGSTDGSILPATLSEAKAVPDQPSVDWGTLPVASIVDVGYQTIEGAGVAVNPRTVLNFIGGGVSCVDNVASSRTDCTVTSLTNPMTTLGDLIYGATSGVPARLGGNASTIPEFLESVGNGTSAAAPLYAQINFNMLAGTIANSQFPNAVTLPGSLTVAGQLTANGNVVVPGTLTVNQASNGADTYLSKRFTDTSPTGNYLNLENAAGSASVFKVDVSGNVTATGGVFTSLTDSGLTAGNCVQAGTGGLFGTTAGPCPQTLGAVSHDFLTSYSAATGLFAQAQPAFSDLSGSATCSQLPALAGGDVTSSAGSCVTALGNIPTGVTMAGSVVATEIAAPAAPAAGKDTLYTDSTDLRFHDKNSAGAIGTTVVSDTGAANNFLTGISAAGVISKAQPAFSNLSGSATCSQLPALTGDVTTSAGSCATALGNIPSATPMAGSVLATNIAAPGTPAAGKTSIYVDSTQKVLSAKNDAGTVSVTVVPSTLGAHNFATSISAAGVLGGAQPAFSDLSGSIATSQVPAGTGCSANQYANALNASLALGCAQVTYSQLSGTPLSVTNDTTTGTTVNTLTKINSSGNAIIAATTDTAIPVFIAASGAGKSGSVSLSVLGISNCVFDGATTADHFVQASTTTGGDCHDAGATAPSSGWVIGQVTTTNASGGTYAVLLSEGYNAAAGGGGGGLSGMTAGQIPVAASASTVTSSLPLAGGGTQIMEGTLTNPTDGIDLLGINSLGVLVNETPGVPGNAQTGTTYTFTGTDRGKTVTFNNGSSISATVPTAGTCSGGTLPPCSSAFFNSNPYITIWNIGAGTVTLSSPTLAAPANPTLTTSGTGCPSGTYLFYITYVTPQGETTKNAAEQSSGALTGACPQVPSPAASGNATGYNVYATTGASNTETKQNTSIVAIGAAFTVPTTGLISGGALPSSNTTNSLFFSPTAPTGAATYAITTGQWVLLQSGDNVNYTVLPNGGSGSSGLSGMTAGQVPIAATASTITSSKALQGTDASILTAGTISGTSVLLCTDANGGATTASCPSGGASPGGGVGNLQFQVNGTTFGGATTTVVRNSGSNQIPAIPVAGTTYILSDTSANYVQTAAVALSAGNVEIYCTNKNVVIEFSGATDGFDVTSNGNRIDNCTLDHNSQTGAGTGPLINWTAGNNNHFDNVGFQNTGSTSPTTSVIQLAPPASTTITNGTFNHLRCGNVATICTADPFMVGIVSASTETISNIGVTDSFVNANYTTGNPTFSVLQFVESGSQGIITNVKVVHNTIYWQGANANAVTYQMKAATQVTDEPLRLDENVFFAVARVNDCVKSFGFHFGEISNNYCNFNGQTAGGGYSLGDFFHSKFIANSTGEAANLVGSPFQAVDSGQDVVSGNLMAGCNSGGPCYYFSSSTDVNSDIVFTGNFAQFNAAGTGDCFEIQDDATGINTQNWEFSSNHCLGDGTVGQVGLALVDTLGTLQQIHIGPNSWNNVATAISIGSGVLDTQIDSQFYGTGVTTRVSDSGTRTLPQYVHLTAQGANIAATTAYAVQSWGAGRYEVCANVNVTRAASGGTPSSTLPNVNVIWTDNDSGAAVTFPLTPTETGNTTGTGTTACADVNAKASTNIQYSTTNFATAGTTSMQYNLNVIVRPKQQ